MVKEHCFHWRMASFVCGMVLACVSAQGFAFDEDSYQNVPIAAVVAEHAGEGGVDPTGKITTMLTIEARINKLQDVVMYQGRKRVISDMHRKLIDGYLKATKNSTNFGAIHPFLKNEIEVRDERGTAYWIPIQESLEKWVEGEKWVRLFLSYNGSVNNDPVLVIHTIKAEDMLSAAEKELTGMINRHDDGAYASRALLYFEKGLYFLAVRDFEKAMELSPDYINTVLYFNGANAYYENFLKYHNTNDLARAQNILDTVGENNFDDKAYCLRGSIYFELKDYANALKNYNKAIKLNPENNTRLRYFLNESRKHVK